MIGKKTSYLLLAVVLLICNSCSHENRNEELQLKISLVNAPSDIVTLGARFLSEKIYEKSNGEIAPQVYHSGVLSGEKDLQK